MLHRDSNFEAYKRSQQAAAQEVLRALFLPLRYLAPPPLTLSQEVEACSSPLPQREDLLRGGTEKKKPDVKCGRRQQLPRLDCSASRSVSPAGPRLRSLSPFRRARSCRTEEQLSGAAQDATEGLRRTRQLMLQELQRGSATLAQMGAHL